MKCRGSNQAGFSLVELAVVLAIVTLLIAGAMAALRVQLKHGNFTETQENLQEAKQALLAYAATQGVLPCPADPSADSASASYGMPTTSCAGTHRRGLLPWKRLGLQGSDAWGQYLSYEVAPAFTETSINTNTQGDIAIGEQCSTAIIDPAIAFVVWSQGENGNGGIPVEGSQRSASDDPDEICNAPTQSPSPIVVRAHSDSFDDQATAVSRFVLFKQMLDAGVSILRPPASSSSSPTSPSSSGGG